MNNPIAMVALGAFMIPVAIVLVIHSDELLGFDPPSDEPGKLLYFYSPS